MTQLLNKADIKIIVPIVLVYAFFTNLFSFINPNDVLGSTSLCNVTFEFTWLAFITLFGLCLVQVSIYCAPVVFIFKLTQAALMQNFLNISLAAVILSHYFISEIFAPFFSVCWPEVALDMTEILCSFIAARFIKWP